MTDLISDTQSNPEMDIDSVTQAIGACVRHARQTHYRSIAELAKTMLVSTDSLYKWVQTGRIPAVEIPNFEKACGIDALSRALSRAAGNIAVCHPQGEQRKEVTTNHLQQQFHQLVGQLLDDAADGEVKIGAINAVMDLLAQLRENIAWESGWKDQA